MLIGPNIILFGGKFALPLEVGPIAPLLKVKSIKPNAIEKMQLGHSSSMSWP